jgi:FtsH-binding integral membrane protein
MQNNLTNQQVVVSTPKLTFFARTMLWFGTALIITFLVAFGIPGILYAAGLDSDTFFTALIAMCVIGGIGVIIFSIIAMIKSLGMRGLGRVTFIIYAIMMGLALTPLYLIGSTPTGLLGIIYSVAVTGGIFVIMGIIGVLSKGRIGMMLSLVIGFSIGALILSIVNLFFFNDLVSWIVSFAILLVFILYVGIDFAIIARHPNDAKNELAILCAFSLYTDFIVIFIRLLPIILRMLGDR